MGLADKAAMQEHYLQCVRNVDAWAPPVQPLAGLVSASSGWQSSVHTRVAAENTFVLQSVGDDGPACSLQLAAG